MAVPSRVGGIGPVTKVANINKNKNKKNKIDGNDSNYLNDNSNHDDNVNDIRIRLTISFRKTLVTKAISFFS